MSRPTRLPSPSSPRFLEITTCGGRHGGLQQANAGGRKGENGGRQAALDVKSGPASFVSCAPRAVKNGRSARQDFVPLREVVVTVGQGCRPLMCLPQNDAVLDVDRAQGDAQSRGHSGFLRTVRPPRAHSISSGNGARRSTLTLTCVRREEGGVASPVSRSSF